MDNNKENKNTKCNFKCKTCTYYNAISDFCKEKEIKHCSKKTNTDFSKCDSYLVSERLIWF